MDYSNYFNTNYFNIIVSDLIKRKGENEFTITLLPTRYEVGYNDDISYKYGNLKENKKEIKKLPSLFLHETKEAKTGYLGIIKEIKQTDKEINVKFLSFEKFDNNNTVINKILSKNESFNSIKYHDYLLERTHWFILPGDLLDLTSSEQKGKISTYIQESFKVKIFLSWSGKKSKGYIKQLKKDLCDVNPKSWTTFTRILIPNIDWEIDILVFLLFYYYCNP